MYKPPQHQEYDNGDDAKEDRDTTADDGDPLESFDTSGFLNIVKKHVGLDSAGVIF